MKKLNLQNPWRGFLFLTILSLSALTVSARSVEPDTTSKAEAIKLAKESKKMIMLIVSDTNSCSGCISLEFSSLPTTTPPIRQMVDESFVYWKCGGEVHSCNDYGTYTGTGTFPLPAYFIIDPEAPQTYRFSGFGGGDPVTFYNFLTRGLLKSTAPLVNDVVAGSQTLSVPAGKATNLVVRNSDILVQGHSVSTNLTLKRLRYSLNDGAWTYFTVTNHLTWELPLHLQPGTNSLKFYAFDISGNYTSRTNVSSFVYQQASASDPLVLPVQQNQTWNPLTPFSVINTATRSGAPAQGISYKLQGPDGSAIDANGVITWTPAEWQAQSTNLFVTVATDSQNLKATNSFKVTVNPLVLPELAMVSTADGRFQFQMSGVVGPRYIIQTSPDMVNWTDYRTIEPSDSPVDLSATKSPAVPMQFYRVRIAP